MASGTCPGRHLSARDLLVRRLLDRGLLVRCLLVRGLLVRCLLVRDLSVRCVLPTRILSFMAFRCAVSRLARPAKMQHS